MLFSVGSLSCPKQFYGNSSSIAGQQKCINTRAKIKTNLETISSKRIVFHSNRLHTRTSKRLCAVNCYTTGNVFFFHSKIGNENAKKVPFCR